MEPLPLIVIVGPTASGKTGLAIKIAKKYGGEVISADSRAIYKGMDIGAAKPTLAEQDGIPHWGFDLVEPGERYTAADFKIYANQKITEIRARGHLPILAGGTGLYVNAVLFGYEFSPEHDVDKRKKWETMDIEKLHGYCTENNIKLPENKQNKRYVINAILRNGHALGATRIPGNDIVVGITTERDVLRDRIRVRIERQFSAGVVDETRLLAQKYGWENEAMTGNMYRILRRYIDGQVSEREAKELCATKDWQLAKRQATWFKRNEHIKWFPVDEAYTYLAHSLDNLDNL